MNAWRHAHVLALVAAASTLWLSGCLSFDEDGNLFFDPPSFVSGETFLEDLRNRLENHDPDAVREFCVRGFEALHGDDPDDLARLQSCAAAISRRGPALPGVKEYESWLESRMLYFEAAEDARLAAEQAKRNAEIERRAAAAQRAARARAEQARAAQARKPRGGVRTPPRLPPEPVETPAFDVASLPPLPDTYTTKPKPPREAPATAATPSSPKPKQTAASAQGTTRGRAYWSKKIARRDPPRRAADVVPRLEAVFRDSGLPPQLVWLAEVESSMDPAAKSPAGAVGLFQLMPATARSLGLATSPKDQRLDPEKNARAAATYLKALHRRFGSWPLALAAYNAGEGKVSGLCRRRGTRAFDDIADALPTETQMYVPRVLETIRARTGSDPDALPPPRT